MTDMTDAQFLQLALVVGPILSLIATWMSLRTYGRLRQKSLAQRNGAFVAGDSMKPASEGSGHE